MSKNYWQIKKQMEPLRHGGTIASKVMAWEARWADRCYPSGIPDDVPDGLLYSGRVPSWKAIALALLRNDLHLRALGFSVLEPPWVQGLSQHTNEEDFCDPHQLDLLE